MVYLLSKYAKSILDDGGLGGRLSLREACDEAIHVIETVMYGSRRFTRDDRNFFTTSSPKIIAKKALSPILIA